MPKKKDRPEHKMIVVGARDSGKTSLVNMLWTGTSLRSMIPELLTGEEYIHPSSCKYFFSYSKMIMVDGEECKLSILDSSEEERYVSTLFYQSISLISCPSFFHLKKHNSCLKSKN